MKFTCDGRALILAIALVGVGFMPRPTKAFELQGAGSTFAAPLYRGWIQEFRKTHHDVSINYAPVGSGEGLERFEAGSVDFAGVDVAIPEIGGDRHDGVGLQLPVTAGMVVLGYNLPGVAKLDLPRAVYADIFRRRIKMWNDPQIAAANPGVQLPSIPIHVVARQDSSGTTFVFTSHLSAISPSWEPGVGKIVSWGEHIVLADGNEGVAEKIKGQVGAIGYVEYGVAKRSSISMAQLQNKAGRYVAPSLESCQISVFTREYHGVEWLKNMILDPDGLGAYPIVTFSWMVLKWEYPSDKDNHIQAFVNYILDEGQKLAPQLGYASLPAPIVYRGKMVLGRVTPSNPDFLSYTTGATAPAGQPGPIGSTKKTSEPGQN